MAQYTQSLHNYEVVVNTQWQLYFSITVGSTSSIRVSTDIPPSLLILFIPERPRFYTFYLGWPVGGRGSYLTLHSQLIDNCRVQSKTMAFIFCIVFLSQVTIAQTSLKLLMSCRVTLDLWPSGFHVHVWLHLCSLLPHHTAPRSSSAVVYLASQGTHLSLPHACEFQ